jgi:hypothetical protein
MISNCNLGSTLAAASLLLHCQPDRSVCLSKSSGNHHCMVGISVSSPRAALWLMPCLLLLR